jgi:hypothetical protein
MGILNTPIQRFGKEILDCALTLLAEVMAHRGHPPCHFVVCGGSSLLALDLISRTTTRDVDVLARLEAKHLVQAKPLPDAVVEAVESVRSQLDLPQDWFYAAVDQGPGRHVSDLQDLQPTAEELLAAARWTRQQDPSEGFLFVLTELLNQLGHADIAPQL